ncbi:MAG: acetate--CoA ligase family protein [Desulfobacteraceae bacterium]|jgi:acetyltransferase
MEREGEKNEKKETTLMSSPEQFSNFFYPKSIAVIGVSPDQNNLGRNIVMNCLMFGYEGEILSIGLKKGVVFGQQIYPSVEQIDRDIHLAVILTPAKSIPGILGQCGRKGIKSVVIESSGFSELGQEGGSLADACIEVARRYGIRIIGPNGLGVTNLENGMALPFMPLRREIALGPVSVLAQSGGVGLGYVGFLAEEDIGINKFVSLGNKMDVDENELLEYLIHDEGTRIILLYLEGFTDGRKFVEIASKSEKPILVHKSNRFRASAQIAHSHTAALFTDDQLVDHALEQAGCVRVNTMDDAMDYIKTFTLPPLKGNRLAVVSRSGGHAVIAADACAHYGFHLPPFPEEFLKKVESRLRAHVIRLQNPLDLGDLFDLEFYEYIVEEMLKRKDVDGVMLGHGYRRSGFEQEASRNLIRKVEQLVERYQKPVALFVMTEAVEMGYLRKHSNIPIFSAPENAMRAFHLSHSWASRKPISIETQTIRDVNVKGAEAILHMAAGNDSLLLKDSLDLIGHYGLTLPDYRLARSLDEAFEAWRAFNAPVVMKINRPHISHKTDLGAISLNLHSQEQIRAVFRHFQSLADSRDLEVLIQPMVREGQEVILGCKHDEIFGPVVLFGLGGILVEALGDVVWRVAPINREEAGRMINQIKGRQILSGIRGAKPSDTNAIEEFLVRLSQMMVDLPLIKEIDVNPVIVYAEGEGALAVDARVIIEH